MKLSIVVIAVVALAWAAHLLITDRDPPPQRTIRAPETSGTALRSSRPPTLPQLTPSARVTADAPRNDAVAEGSAAATRAAPAPTSAEVRDRLDEVFRAETIDTTWSQNAARTLDGKLAALLPARSAVRSVDCRGSLCRIETSHAGLDEYRDFVERAFLGQTELWNAGFYTNVLVDPVPGQPVITVAYLAREGQSLPSADTLFGAR
jgi:hypothetical protein